MFESISNLLGARDGRILGWEIARIGWQEIIDPDRPVVTKTVTKS